MSSVFKLKWGNEAPQITIERMDEPAHCHEINTEEVMDQPWFHEVKRYLEAQEYPEGASVNNKKFLSRFYAKFFLSNRILYKRKHDSVLLHFIYKVEAKKIMVDLHRELLEPILVGIQWLRRSYGQVITGLPWKLPAINTPTLVTTVKSMQTRCTFLQFL